MLTLDLIEEKLISLNYVVSPHKYGGIQFDANGQELGHIHSNGLVDIIFTKAKRDELVRNRRAEEHHFYPKSGWVSYYVKNLNDLEKVVDLFQLSHDERLV